ncbi:MAG: SnoaL-like domain-containing protein [Acidiferrobacteraceae bacterium]|jgi:methanesulfonate monooxygenase small subunit|nr:SnoaL-like domain-containing protein [Acidiferrobacteraceae bacterium]MBT3972620.1 SnoaL-like domain-containing protein [Acidiferrobacteraceae bacterium]MBT4403503.1 SnoaL-like domain-containing protein [Acidiferrobacteraceae bacterium]MBT4806663.1 SnoaL-like domain-containing protein [Acidiferrobacteraceae bacterium]MBT5344868.1 SnoaL-like domain-containing protein [Acidiferrobacteraceae bacterium]
MTEQNITEDVKSTIYRASLYLDEGKWEDWLGLCHEDFYYAIRAFSPEINYNMTYLDGSRADMVTITEMLPKHNSDHSPLARHTVVYTVDVDEAQQTASTVSSFAVYQTQLDGINSHVLAGESNVFLVGKYRDQFRIDSGRPLFVERIVQLDTRRLDKGSHWPI